MGLVEWARSPWGQDIPIHISFFLIWVAAIAGLVFLIGHAIWLKYFDTPDVFQPTPAAETVGVPPRVKRHSLAARLFHWVMAASMLTLLVTAFLPRVGVQFAWVDLSLDRRRGSDHFHPFSPGPRDLLHGPLGHLA